jgi:hypothetical protein
MSGNLRGSRCAQAAIRRLAATALNRHYIAMIYMTAGKLNFGLPT